MAGETYNFIPISSLDANSPVDTTTMVNLGRNPEGIAAGVPGAPSVLQNALEDYVAGTYIINTPIESIKTSTVFVKALEYYMPRSGTVTTRLGVRFLASGTVAAQIYKNGVAFGAVRAGSLSTFIYYNEDLAFTAGDLIQVYIKHNTGGFQVAGILEIKTGNPNSGIFGGIV